MESSLQYIGRISELLPEIQQNNSTEDQRNTANGCPTGFFIENQGADECSQNKIDRCAQRNYKVEIADRQSFKQYKCGKKDHKHSADHPRLKQEAEIIGRLMQPVAGDT